MIPIDNSLKDSGVHFLRYADDMTFFCDSETEARKILRTVATTLDRQQRLLIQRHKTKIFRADEFRDYCAKMVQDRPISLNEDRILKVIRRYSGGDPYAAITYNQISPEDWKEFSGEIVTGIINEYLQADEVDYIRLRWFFRRLATGRSSCRLESCYRQCRIVGTMPSERLLVHFVNTGNLSQRMEKNWS